MIDDLRFTISGGFVHYKDLLEFNNNIKSFYDIGYNLIDSVYDNGFGLSWNGGRILRPNYFWTIKEIIDAVDIYNSNGIGFNFTFQRLNIPEKDLDDKVCNDILSQLNNGMNGIIYVDEKLGEYVNKNYPNYKLIYSACAYLTDLDDYKRQLDRNDLVVVMPDFNRDYDFLDKLPDKDRIEIIVNEPCFYRCPYRKDHIKRVNEYNESSINKLNFYQKPLDGFDLCLARYNGYNDIDNPTNALSINEMNKLADIGFKNFKLVGRE